MAGVLLPQRRDTLGEVAKGLQIAGSLYGLYGDYRKLEAEQKKAEVEAEKNKRLAEGKINLEEYKTILKDFTPTPQGREGTVKYNIYDPDTGDYNEQWLTPRADLEMEQRTKDKADDREARQIESQENRESREAMAREGIKSREAMAEENRKIREMYLATQKVKGDHLPIELKTQINKLATQNANKISIGNQLAAGIKEFQNAKTETDKIRIGQQMVKTLNSTESADAVGVEEVKRLANALEFQVGNFFGTGQAFGRDLPGFETQVISKINEIGAAIKSNQFAIEKLKTGGSISLDVPEKTMGKTDGATANAAPPRQNSAPLNADEMRELEILRAKYRK